MYSYSYSYLFGFRSFANAFTETFQNVMFHNLQVRAVIVVFIDGL